MIINDSKCELVNDPNFAHPFSAFLDFAHVNPNQVSLLGAPLLQGPALDAFLAKCCEVLAKAIDRLELLQADDALILLRYSFSAPNIRPWTFSMACSETELAV